MKAGAKYVAGALLMAFLFWFVLKGVDLQELRADLARASLTGLLLAAAINLAHNLFRAWRWGLLLAPVQRAIPLRPRISAILIGYMTTWTVPGRLGELVRPVLLSAREKVPFGPCVGSILVDRLLDGVAIVVLFALGTQLAPPVAGGQEQAALVVTTAWALLAVLAVGLALLIVAGHLSEHLRPWVESRTGIPRMAGRAVLALVAGSEALRRPRLLLPILGHSFAAWLTIALATWIAIRASGVDVPFGATLVLLPPLALGVALPTPGGAGGYHWAMKVGLLHLYGVPEAAAVSTGILAHLTMTIPVIVVGVALLKIDGISFGELRGLVSEVARGAKAEAVAPPVPLERAAS
jgi:uncharacterized membrane protein YbhN (UPF0104 family)